MDSVRSQLQSQLGKIYQAGHRAQVDPSQLYEINRDLRAMADEFTPQQLQQASGEIKTGFLSDTYHQVPQGQDAARMAREINKLTQATGAGENELEQAAETEYQYNSVLASQGHEMARGALAMGLLCGALDAVIISCLDGTSGAADPSLRPEVDGNRERKFVEVLYNEPDKARARHQRLKQLEGVGTLKHISYHVGSADVMVERMMTTTQPQKFKDSSLRLFADAYHIGMNLVYKDSPELQPADKPGNEVDLELTEDGFLIGDFPVEFDMR